MPLIHHFTDALPVTGIAAIERQYSPQAQTGGGAAPIIRYHGGTASPAHQPPGIGFTEGPPWDPVDPVRERFGFYK